MRDTERGRERSRLLTGSLMWDLIPKLGSSPEPKAEAQPLSHPAIQAFLLKSAVGFSAQEQGDLFCSLDILHQLQMENELQSGGRTGDELGE